MKIEYGELTLRITNIDTLSAYFDRLITERIKWYFFTKDGDLKKAEHQENVIYGVLSKISDLLKEVYASGKYEYLAERRTFNLDEIVRQLDELTQNDIKIGEADRMRLKELTSENPTMEHFLEGEKLLRLSNEGRALNKNKIDENFKSHFKCNNLKE